METYVPVRRHRCCPDFPGLNTGMIPGIVPSIVVPAGWVIQSTFAIFNLETDPCSVSVRKRNRMICIRVLLDGLKPICLISQVGDKTGPRFTLDNRIYNSELLESCHLGNQQHEYPAFNIRPVINYYNATAQHTIGRRISHWYALHMHGI